MNRWRFLLVATLSCICAQLAMAAGPSTRRADEAVAVPVGLISAALGKGTMDDEVYTIVKPRKDLLVSQIDMGDVPAAAGLASVFHFFPCPCGKTNLIGQFCVADYELNVVVDELRKADIQIASVAPMLLGEKPRVFIIRFFARAEAAGLVEGLRNALRWTSDKPKPRK